MNLVNQNLRVADEAWIASALLHRENPGRSDFEIGEIVERARRENAAGQLRPGLRTHVTQHCVANKAPNPGRYCMLLATGKHTRRLYRPGDPQRPERTGKILPKREEIPEKYHNLLDWWEDEYAKAGLSDPAERDPILALSGAGRGIRPDSQHPDAYVRQLRKGWR